MIARRGEPKDRRRIAGLGGEDAGELQGDDEAVCRARCERIDVVESALADPREGDRPRVVRLVATVARTEGLSLDSERVGARRWVVPVAVSALRPADTSRLLPPTDLYLMHSGLIRNGKVLSPIRGIAVRLVHVADL